MDRASANGLLAAAMAEELARCGVRQAVLSPGSRSTPLALALSREAGIDSRVVLDERSAGFVALGAALAGRSPVAVLCTSGSAAANLHPAVVEADEAGVPLIVLTADRPPELRAIGAGQTIDQIKLYGAAVRWFCEVGVQEADDAGLLHFRSVACRACAVAMGEPRPGPVHLNLPFREPLVGDATTSGEMSGSGSPRPDAGALAREGRPGAPLTSVAVPSLGPSPDALGDLLALIAERPRGLIAAGRHPGPGLGAALAELSAATGYPILAEPTSQVRLGPHDRSGVVWAYDAIARARPRGLEPTLVLRFGDMPTSKALRQWLSELEPDQAVIAPHGWNEPTRKARLIVRADGPWTASALAARGPRPSAGGDWRAAWIGAGERAAAAIRAELAALDEPSEPGLQQKLAELYADGDLVFTGSSMPIRDQEAFLPDAAAEVVFLANRGANGIDGLISSAAGAALASGRPTWVITGDLGLVHDAAGLAALPAAPPVRIVVVNNAGGGIFEFLPQADLLDRDEFERLFATPAAVEPAALAGAHGLPHRELATLDELEGLPAAPSGVYELRTDRRENVELHRSIAARVAEVLAELDE